MHLKYMNETRGYNSRINPDNSVTLIVFKEKEKKKYRIKPRSTNWIYSMTFLQLKTIDFFFRSSVFLYIFKSNVKTLDKELKD